jgi:multidrug transporter EmrE-like cation transporter
VLTATLLSLGAAVLHAGWNLAVKQSATDRFIALWGQFLAAGALAAVALIVGGGIPIAGYGWAALSGLVHIPYCVMLARAYTTGDFSVMYPIARGGGALLAGVGGLALLDDRIGPVGIVGMVVVTTGLALLAGHTDRRRFGVAATVATTIGAYTLCDAQGIRATDTPLYAAATFVAIAIATTSFGVAMGRGGEMVAAARTLWRRFLLLGAASAITYTMVQLALRLAAVGYVTCLRESSVVIAAFVGAHYLGEGGLRRRVGAAAVVLTGLVLLIAGA